MAVDKEKPKKKKKKNIWSEVDIENTKNTTSTTIRGGWRTKIPTYYSGHKITMTK